MRFRNTIKTPFSWGRKYSKSLKISKPVLYGDEVSPPVRFVMMTASLLKIELEFIQIDLFSGENRSESYAKINPLKKVPALAVDNNIILDSHAAAIYLCQTLSSQHLYPNDIILRAKLNEMLFYNSSTLFRLDSEILSQYFAGKLDETKKIEEWQHALDYLDSRLEKNIWLTGNKMNLSDLCLMSTITSMQQLFPLTNRHRKLLSWINRFDNVPEVKEINNRGLRKLKHYIDLFDRTKRSDKF
ncbi:unnamed protein product [Leptosia nina]|uniref:Glutathione S-transferase n=1 Tax=Leptosia nina TaxID=320188 RepID=A0AAV1JMX7_9NEOP